MVDLSFRKLLGHRIAWALALAFLAAALWIPAGAQAATGVPGVPSAVTALPDVPATAQAAVGAALAQAGGGDVDRASVAAVPAPVPSVSSSPAPGPRAVGFTASCAGCDAGHHDPDRARRRPRVGFAGRLFADSRSGARGGERSWSGAFRPQAGPGRVGGAGADGRRQRQRCAPSATVRPPWSGQRCASKLRPRRAARGGAPDRTRRRSPGASRWRRMAQARQGPSRRLAAGRRGRPPSRTQAIRERNRGEHRSRGNGR